MVRRLIVQTGLLALAFALATFAFGWLAVPVVGLVWGLVARAWERPALVAALAAGLGWAVLLVWDATQGPVGELARRTAGVMGLPSAGLVVLTVAYPMLIAWGAAVLGMVGRRWGRR
ncbi:MAG: hypothetical protein ACE5HT_02990 [Gemmatimonadales bacterium]